MSYECIDVLIPTCNRPAALAATLATVAVQSWPTLRIVISDQSEDACVFEMPEVAAVLRFLGALGRDVETCRHLPRRGMAEQRAFLLSRSTAKFALFLDDDVLLEADLIERLHKAIRDQECGFVGSALHGLSYLDDVRPRHQLIEFWVSRVTPEKITPGSPAWSRHHLHSAANLFHLQQRLGLERGDSQLYRVAWIGGCVLFDTEKLRAAGGFDFWEALPPQHSGEDVLAQLRVMACHGGCGLIPSGAYHQELPTTLPCREVDAPFALPLDFSDRPLASQIPDEAEP